MSGNNNYTDSGNSNYLYGDPYGSSPYGNSQYGNAYGAGAYSANGMYGGNARYGNAQYGNGQYTGGGDSDEDPLEHKHNSTPLSGSSLLPTIGISL